MEGKQILPSMGGSTIAAKLTRRLIKELQSGEYANQDKLPAEVELAEHYGVSRSVIRDVLANLEREGFIERGRGIGTTIHREIINLNNRLDLKFEYNELVRDRGREPSSDSIKLYEKPAEKDLAGRLHIPAGATVLVREKRVLASGEPVIYSIDHVPLELFSRVDYRTLDWMRPIFDLLEEACGIVVDTDISRIAASNGPPEVRKKLEVPEGEALLFMDGVGYYKLSYPIIQTYGYYTNFFDFTMLRKKF